jgi:uncharacterized protein (DUF2147 family)
MQIKLLMRKLSILLLSLFVSAVVFANDSIVGLWENSNGKTHFEVYKVKDKYFARIVQLKEPIDENGLPKVDKKNPDINQQTRPIVGLVVVRNLVYSQDDNEWKDGNIYNPEDGRIYKCMIKLKDNNTMDVRGYIGFTCLGKTTTMRRIK